MNDTTENTQNTSKSAKSAFGDRGTNRNSINYGHPYAEQILEGAKKIIRESETGQTLLRMQAHHNIPIQIMKGTGPSGFNPQSRIIYLQIPGNTDKATPTIILNLVKGLREADQELIGFTAPDPSKDLMEYATVMHSKALDAIVYMCRFLKELTNSSYFPVLLDEMKHLGHIKVYQAYIDDASKEELFDAYAGT